jgi:glycosyltransferase involved in cell wall biosynthesis
VAEEPSDRRIVMVGAYPPPFHGMAAINEAVRRQVVDNGAVPIVFDISASNLDRSISTHFGKFRRVIRGLAGISFRRGLNKATLYMSISGGWGQLYEVFFLLVARLRGMRRYIHHHSFAYIDHPSRLAGMLTFVSGQTCVHVVLSQSMANRLQEAYPRARRTLVISNAAFFGDEWMAHRVDRRKLNTIGFISNISREKGIFEFLDLAARCESKGLKLKAKIAGPFQDKATERLVKSEIKKLRTVEYLGPRYGEDKERFFQSIDVLVFPTLYANEAEPLTIHEAMSRGVPVIARGRGCIPEIVRAGTGRLVAPGAQFVEKAMNQLEEWAETSIDFENASQRAGQCFEQLYAESRRRWIQALGEMLPELSDQ